LSKNIEEQKNNVNLYKTQILFKFLEDIKILEKDLEEHITFINDEKIRYKKLCYNWLKFD